MTITHFGISHYRSIGEAPVMLDITKKINVLVGPNNAGKSNVLQALRWFGERSDQERSFGPIDWHQRKDEKKPAFHLRADLNNHIEPRYKQIGYAEIVYEGHHVRTPKVSHTSLDSLSWEDFRVLYATTGSRFNRYVEPSKRAPFEAEVALKIFGNTHELFPPVGFVPVFREIRPSEDYKVAGQGIARLLAHWQQPAIERDGDRMKFDRVVRFLQQLLSIPVTLEVPPATSDTILVNRDGLRLPLSSYGTGIHELIILAIAVLSFDNAIVCIEEPEIHLHPLLQRRFLQFLRTDTTNRYVITTHSPALIGLEDETAVTHLWLENGITKSRTVASSADSLRALRDLGAQASDLLQANSVIWVEGPSDRIYVNRWLELLHPGAFREGIDYTVMFYGGRLLSHLSFERDLIADTTEDEASELIQLLRINQHSAVLIDSDRRKSADPLNKTKQRILTECKAAEVFCWVTPGREIENCLDEDAVSRAYSKLSGATISVSLGTFHEFEKALHRALTGSWPRSSYYNHAKAQMARLIAQELTKESLSNDVKALIEALVKTIRHTTLGPTQIS